MDINQRYPNLKFGIRTVKQPLFLCEPCRSFSSPSFCSLRAGSAGERFTSNGASSAASAIGGGRRTRLLGDVAVDSAAAVSLRAHGVVVGTLVIANPRDRTFPPEDMRLLSTVATHAAIVIANARFFQMVQHAKEQWETAFDALSEGIAVVDDHGCISRANRALAAMLGAPIAGVIGCNLGEALLGPSPALLELLVAAREGARVQPVVLRSATLGRTIRVNAARIPAPAPAHDRASWCWSRT